MSQWIYTVREYTLSDGEKADHNTEIDLDINSAADADWEVVSVCPRNDENGRTMSLIFTLKQRYDG